VRPNPSRARVAAATALILALAACRATNTDTNEVYVSGSSTVEPITTRVAELYAEQNPDFSYTIEAPGTGDGFALFCNGETDISDASRAIRDEEAQTCADNGIQYVELQVAFDGLSVITAEANDAVDCLSFLDLYALLGPESEGFENWSDANDLAEELAGELDAAEFGESHAPYPDEPLIVTAPGEESGTFDSFVELVIADIAEARGADETTRPDYTPSANDNNVIIDGIAGAESSLGWVGFAFAEGAEGVKLLEIDGGDGCVAPSSETVSDGSYAISRPLFIYPNLEKAESNPVVAPFVDFYLSDEGIAAVSEVGYVELPDDELQATREAWEGR
jgi:phosphate transport system substrate-binding protein